MRILFLTPFFPNNLEISNGIFNLERSFALKERGHEIVVVAPVGITPPSRFFSSFLELPEIWNHIKRKVVIPNNDVVRGVKVYRPKWIWFPKKMFWGSEAAFLDFFAGRMIQKIVLEFKPDCYLCSWANPFGVYGKYLKKINHKPVYLILEGSDIFVEPRKYSGWDYIRNQINSCCDKIICVSSLLYSQAEGMGLRNLSLVKNGYNQSLFYNCDRDPNVLRKPRILSVGYLGATKGHDLLLSAMLTLKDEYELTIVGHGENFKIYKKFIDEHGLKQSVKLLGNIPHDQLRQCYCSHDVFCLPSRFESFCVAAIEAMACGLPVVSARIGELAECLVEEFNGIYYSPGCAESLAKSIRRAASINWNRQDIAKWALNNYSWRKWAGEIVELLGG